MIPDRITLRLLVELSYLSRATSCVNKAEHGSMEWLHDHGLIRATEAGWTATAKGCALVDHFMATPLPEAYTDWRVPTPTAWRVHVEPVDTAVRMRARAESDTGEFDA